MKIKKVKHWIRKHHQEVFLEISLLLVGYSETQQHLLLVVVCSVRPHQVDFLALSQIKMVL
jgi:hypothetical protein